MLLDAAVGIAFVAAGLLTRRATLRMRGWWAVVGVAWWAGSVVPELTVAHQGALLGALAAYPTGWPPTRWGLVALVAAVVVGGGLATQGGAGLAFLVCALFLPGRRPFARLSGALVGSWLLGSFAWSRVWPATFDPDVALVGYELIMLLVAVGMPLSRTVESRRSDALTDRVFAAAPSGLMGLEAVLRQVLRAPTLRLETFGNDVRVTGFTAADSGTAQAVDRAVELTIEHERTLLGLAAKTQELEAARARLLAVADVERQRAATRLGGGLVTLRACTALMSGSPRAELANAALRIEAILSGLPPERLGRGRIVPAVEEMCARHPIPVALRCDPHVASDETAETALFYVCSEALANSAKHSQAHHVRVTIDVAGEIVLSVADDGVGGADPSGGGLTGLRDRLSAVGGHLQIDSPDGGGTRIVARVPRIRLL